MVYFKVFNNSWEETHRNVFLGEESPRTDSEKERSIVSLIPLYISGSTMFPPKAAALLLLQHLPKKKERVLFQ